MRRATSAIIIGVLLLPLSASAVQNPPSAFEVISVKPSNADPNSSGIDTRNGRIHGYNVTLKRCIMGAYGVGPNQVVGGPEWLDSDRFEINAKVEENVGGRSLDTMFQTLLVERFKLVIHREMKPTDAYVLELRDNRPKLEKGNGQGATTDNGRGHIVATNASMDRFAEILSRQMDRPVLNRTGLDGVFNVNLLWTADNRSARADDNAANQPPTIFTAIQEQLGLRLRAQKVPVEVIVIDYAEKPEPN